MFSSHHLPLITKKWFKGLTHRELVGDSVGEALLKAVLWGARGFRNPRDTRDKMPPIPTTWLRKSEDFLKNHMTITFIGTVANDQ